MPRATLSLTPEAVHAVLASAGLQAAQMDEHNYRPVTEGFSTCLLPCTMEDRVAAMWHAGQCGEHDQRAVEEAGLARCTTVLHAAGYWTEFVNESGGGHYLVVWVDGDF